MDTALTASFLITCLAFTGIWLIHVSKRNAGVIDFYWGPGFIVIALVTWFIQGAMSVWHGVFLGAIALWALRLTLYLGQRHVRSDEEDGRYRTMRETGGSSYWWTSLFKVFLLQAVILWMVAAPVHAAMRSAIGSDFSAILFLFGIAVFLIGLAVEVLADHQLARSKMNVSNGLVSTGLWSISRHPNYLGEMVLWWGLGAAAFAISGSWFSLIGPTLLTTVMVLISIPLTEQWLEKSRPTYADYKNSVPMLIPFLAAPANKSNRATE